MARRWTAMAVLGLLLAAGTQGAQATTIQELLRDKGIITAEEYEATTKVTGPAYYQPARGFTIETADGKYRTNIGGYGQLLYRYTDADGDRTDFSDFNIRRFKVVFQGNVYSKNLLYRVQGDVSTGWRTEDVFLNYRFGTPLSIQAGQYKPPQARQELTGAGRQLFPERSLANDTFNLGRDLGVQASGAFADHLLAYRLGIFNGNGPNTRNPDNRHMLAGRLDVNPLGAYPLDEAALQRDKPLINIGASFAWQKVGPLDVGTAFNADNDVMDVALNLDQARYVTTPTNDGRSNFITDFGNHLTWLLWTANLNAAWKGAAFAAEYYRLNADPAVGADWNADGYYVQGAYQIIPSALELAARYSQVKSTDADSSARFHTAETQFGANYYFKGHDLKLQADVTLVDEKLLADRDDTRFRLQATFFY